MKTVLLTCVALVSVAAGARAQEFAEELIDLRSALDLARPAPEGSRGKSLVPEPSPEGNRALDELIERLKSDGGVAIEAGPAGGGRFQIAAMHDPEKVKAVVRAHPEWLTAGLR